MEEEAQYLSDQEAAACIILDVVEDKLKLTDEEMEILYRLISGEMTIEDLRLKIKHGINGISEHIKNQKEVIFYK